MKKVLSRLVPAALAAVAALAALVLCPLPVFAQPGCGQEDCDGDGIANASDARPLLADLPYVGITAGPSGGEITSDAEAFKRWLARKLDAKLALGEKITPVLRLGGGEGSDEVVQSIERSAAIERLSHAAGGVRPGEPAATTGSFRAPVEFRNPGAKTVIVGDLKYSVTLLDPCDPGTRKTALAGTLGTGNLLAPGKDAPSAPPDQAPAELKVRAGSVLVKDVWLPGLPAETVLEMTSSRREPRLEITDARLAIGSRTIDREAARASVLAKSIEIRIVDAAGTESVQYVSVLRPGGSGASGGTGGMSLRDALELLASGKVQVRKQQGQTFLSGLGETPSAFVSLADPRTFSRAELAQGAWFAASLSPGFSGSLTDPAPAGTRFVLAFLTRRDLLDALKDVRQFLLKVDDPLHPVTVASVKAGDVVRIRFTASRQPSETTTRSMADAYSISAGFPLKDKRFWELIQATETLPKDALIPIPPQEKAGSYGLRLLFASPGGASREISLDDVPLVCPGSFRHNPDGSAELELLVTPELVPGGQGALQLESTSSTETMKVGRAFGEGGGDDSMALRNPEVFAAALRFAAEWQNQAPLREREVQRLRVFDVSVRVISAVPPRGLSLLTEGDTVKLRSFCGDVTSRACLAAADGLKSRCDIQDVKCLQTIRCTGALGSQLQLVEQACAVTGTGGGDDASCRKAQTGVRAALAACKQP